MATESIEVSGVVHAPPERIYEAWLSSSEHSAMTGSRATVEGNVGGRFSAYDGRIEGAMLALEPGRRIVQRWRSTDFPSDAADSLLEVRLEPTDTGTLVAFVHSEIPEGQATQLEEGWRKYYLEPMLRYFALSSAPSDAEDETPALETTPVRESEATRPQAQPAKKVAAKKSPSRAAKKKAKPAAKKASLRRKKAAKSRRAVPKRSAKKAKARRGKAKRSSRRGKR